MAYWLAGAEREPAVGFALAGYCKLPVEGLSRRRRAAPAYVSRDASEAASRRALFEARSAGSSALLAALRRRLVQELRRATVLRPLRIREGGRVRVCRRQDGRSTSSSSSGDLREPLTPRSVPPTLATSRDRNGRACMKRIGCRVSEFECASLAAGAAQGNRVGARRARAGRGRDGRARAPPEPRQRRHDGLRPIREPAGR